jgi:hypothetical protein
MRLRSTPLQWALVIAGIAHASAVRADAVPDLRLAWDNCRGSGGAVNRAFPCDTNLGQNVLVGSFAAPGTISLLSGVEAVIQFVPSTQAMPDWWRLRNQTGQTNQCRQGSLSASGDFRDLSGCADAFAGAATGGITSYLVYPDLPMSATLRLSWSVPAGTEGPLTGSDEYYAFKVFIDNQKSVGGIVCGGCPTAVCILFASFRLFQPAGTIGGSPIIFPLDGSDQHVANWNGGTAALCGVVPVRATTWGAIKGLYR